MIKLCDRFFNIVQIEKKNNDIDLNKSEMNMQQE
jgi:hypothetical protein